MGKEARKWLPGPEMGHWPQQLNYAIWCASTGHEVAATVAPKRQRFGLAPAAANPRFFLVSPVFHGKTYTVSAKRDSEHCGFAR